MRIVSILGIVILATISITVEAQTVVRALPQLIQNLSDKDYAIWAQWQNRQAIRRVVEIADDIDWMRYNYADRVISNSFSRGNTTARTSNSSNSVSNSSTRGKSRSGSRSTTRNGYANTNFNRFGSTAITSYQTRYLNSDYAGAGVISIYNPLIQPKGGLGTPDWANLFVPCKKGTITMQEVLDRLIGPQNPEKVFKIMLGDYFD